MAGLIIEEAIETGFVTLIKTISYMTSAGVNVTKWRDNATAKNLPAVIVHAMPIQREFQNSNLWLSVVEINCISYDADDTDMGILKDIYQEILKYFDEVSMATLTSGVTSVTFHGIEINQGSIEIQDEYQYMTLNLLFHIQA